jgi:Helix-turn-helix domain
MPEGRGERGANRRIRRKGKPGKRARRARRPRARGKPPRRGRAILVKAMAHPLRRRLLHEINAGDAPLSPAQLAKAFDLPLALVTYHATVMQRCGAVEVFAAEDG